MLINDLTGGGLFADIDEIVLIEPSAPALARAAALYRRIVPGAAIGTVCKRFDDLSDSDVASTSAEHTLHVFSNSLDVPGFDALQLLRRTLQPGRHTILSVSHDRAFNGGTPKIEATKAALEAAAGKAGCTIVQSTLHRFTCTNPRQSKGVAWHCELEIP